MNSPRFAASLQTVEDTSAAIREACRAAQSALGVDAHLAVVFFSPHHLAQAEHIAEAIVRETGCRTILGCNGESVLGDSREIEDEPGLSLWLGHLPGTQLHSFHLRYQRSEDGGRMEGWPDDLPATWPTGSMLLTVGDPYSFPADLLLHRLNQDQPKAVVMGGMASGAAGPGAGRLLVGDKVVQAGASAVLIHSGTPVRTVVSQGCRPIGQPFVVTKSERNIIFEMGGKPALRRLQEVYHALSPEDQQAARGGLHLGRVVNEYQEKFDRGDFLIRNVLGGDEETGAIAIGDYVRVGQTVQFHIRDEATADNDLKELLAEAGSAQGALLFTCNGRGTRLFSAPNHDAEAVQQAMGNIPLAGFFAQGELGPIAKKNFVHGFTASLALFGE